MTIVLHVKWGKLRIVEKRFVVRAGVEYGAGETEFPVGQEPFIQWRNVRSAKSILAK
jgi:hypothetical protein